MIADSRGAPTATRSAFCPRVRVLAPVDSPAGEGYVVAMILPTLLVVTALAGAPSDLALKGCIVAKRESESVAVLTSGGRTRVVAVGETAFGGRLLAVAFGTATLDFDGQSVKVRLASAAAPAARPAPAAQADAAPVFDPETPPRKMARADVDHRLTLEMNRILSETALAPVMDGGRVVGVALSKVAQGSLLTEAGLRPGDVLTEINGTKIDGLATLMGLYARLQGEKELDAVVLRGGRSISLRVTLQ
jgi:general secretion pathway protein C